MHTDLSTLNVAFYVNNEQVAFDPEHYPDNMLHLRTQSEIAIINTILNVQIITLNGIFYSIVHREYVPVENLLKLHVGKR